MKKNVLICGAGGFIGGHLVSNLLKTNNYNIFCADIKPFNQWFQFYKDLNNFSKDLRDSNYCYNLTRKIDYVFNLACNMGGMGFIENNKAECMISVLINTNLLRASVKNNVQKFFFSSSACVYNASKQSKNFIKGLKEEDAYPADPEDGYGWEKLFSERMCRHFKEDFNLETRVVRYHNVYGPIGTFDGGREKAPAALCRKVAEAKLNNIKEIEVWGDGEQTRSFLFIDDCIEGSLKVFDSEFSEVFNVGSDNQVSINELIDLIESIANIKLKRIYLLDKPKGVRGRSSDNNNILKKINWQPRISLNEGLIKTYEWIYDQISLRQNN
jgi:nucleoside-diphosphate-sugar epimerase